MKLLRYYEKIGILKPHHIDEKNGYRYYSPNQLPILDVILLCLDFGMPLKELKECINDGKFINNIKLFELGHKIAEERFKKAQTELNKIDYRLKYLQSNIEHSEETGLYKRKIPERTIVTMEYAGSLDDISNIETTSARLYSYAQEKGLSPVFPAGLIIRKENGSIRVNVFLEIMDKTAKDPLVSALSGGKFLCRKVDMADSGNVLQELENTYGKKTCGEIILANILLDKFQIGTKKSELQKAIH